MNATNASETSWNEPAMLLGFSLTSISLFVGVPLNSFTLWQVFVNVRESFNSKVFFANVIVADLLFSLAGIFYYVFFLASSFTWFYPYMFSSGLIYTARPIFQCCICVDFYVGVVHPVMFLRFQPRRFRLACSFFVWMISLASCIYNLLTLSDRKCLMFYFIENVLLLSTTLFCCLSVLRALNSPGPGENSAERRKSNSVKKKAFKIILAIMISMSINFSLYVSVIPLLFTLPPGEFITTQTVCFSIGALTGYVQPLIYLHKCGKLPFCKCLE